MGQKFLSRYRSKRNTSEKCKKDVTGSLLMIRSQQDCPEFQQDESVPSLRTTSGNTFIALILFQIPQSLQGHVKELLGKQNLIVLNGKLIFSPQISCIVSPHQKTTENIATHQLASHCKKLFQDIGFCPKGKSNRGNLNMFEHRNKCLSSVALFVKTHSFRKSFSLPIGQQNALSRNFIAIIIKDVHLNPLRSY